MTAEPLELIRAVDAWLAPTRDAFQITDTPAVIDFQPGDGGSYEMVFTPTDGSRLVTPGGRSRNAADTALLAVTNFNWCQLISLRGEPSPGYVAEKLANRNQFTVAAVGVVWSLMVGTDPERVADMFESIPAHVWAEWTQVLP